MKVLAVLLMVVALAIIIVPQFTNCEYGKEHPATINMKTSDAAVVAEYASMGSMDTTAAEASVPYRMMRCFWSARAEIIAGIPLFALGAFLLFARRKETFRVVGAVSTLIGIVTILIPTTLVGVCMNPDMVCNTQMQPTLLICGGITVALGIAVLVLGETRRSTDGPVQAVAAA